MAMQLTHGFPLHFGSRDLRSKNVIPPSFCVVFLAIKFPISSVFIVQPKYNVSILYCCAVCYIHSTCTLKELLTSIISSVTLFIVVLSCVYEWLFDFWLTNLVYSALVSFLLIQECMHQLLASFPGLRFVVVVVVVVVVLRFVFSIIHKWHTVNHSAYTGKYWRLIQPKMGYLSCSILSYTTSHSVGLQPLCTQSSNKAWMLALNTAQKLANSVWIVSESIQKHMNIARVPPPSLVQTCNHKMNFICNPIHCLSLDKGLNPGGHCLDLHEYRLQLRCHFWG